MADGNASSISIVNSKNMGFAATQQTKPPPPPQDESDNTMDAMGQYAPKVLRNLNSQRLKNQFSDVGLVAGDSVIRAHRLVLAAASAYFHAMFTGGLVEQHQEFVEIHSIPPKILVLEIGSEKVMCH